MSRPVNEAGELLDEEMCPHQGTPGHCRDCTAEQIESLRAKLAAAESQVRTTEDLLETERKRCDALAAEVARLAPVEQSTAPLFARIEELAARVAELEAEAGRLLEKCKCGGKGQLPPFYVGGPSTDCKSEGKLRLEEGPRSKEAAKAMRAAPGFVPRKRLAESERLGTPLAFRDLLISIAESAQRKAA